MITAGPTQEALDPVRFISNHSTGKMGIALADSLARRDIEVDLILGPTLLRPISDNIKVHEVTSADEMNEVSLSLFPNSHCAILAAAVSDYKPKTYHSQKIKKEKNADKFLLELVRTPDILYNLGSIKNDSQVVIGFALETEEAIKNATQKLLRKNCDMIIVNTLEDKGAGFHHDTNKVTILTSGNDSVSFPLMDKKELAEKIIEFIDQQYFARFVS